MDIGWEGDEEIGERENTTILQKFGNITEPGQHQENLLIL